MKTYKYLLLGFVALGLALTSCKKDDEFKNEVNQYSNKYEFLDARSYEEWVYFSLEENKIVTVENPESDLSWDIAFHRGDVRTNGGASGEGQAEALNTGNEDFDAVLEVPVSGYSKDEIGTIHVAFTGGGTEEEEQPFSQVLSDWLTVDTSNPPPVYTVNKEVYAIKTADGKYAKIQFYDHKNEMGQSGYVSFKYQINTDGNNTFK